MTSPVSGRLQQPNTKDGVSAVPSGSGLTFVMDSSSFEDEDNPSTLVPREFEPEPEKGRDNPGAAMDVGDQEEDEEDDDEDEEEDDDEITAAKRGRELTDKYLAGKLIKVFP